MRRFRAPKRIGSRWLRRRLERLSRVARRPRTRKIRVCARQSNLIGPRMDSIAGRFLGKDVKSKTRLALPIAGRGDVTTYEHRLANQWLSRDLFQLTQRRFLRRNEPVYRHNQCLLQGETTRQSGVWHSISKNNPGRGRWEIYSDFPSRTLVIGVLLKEVVQAEHEFVIS